MAVLMILLASVWSLCDRMGRKEEANLTGMETVLLTVTIGLAQSQSNAPAVHPQFEVATIKSSGICEGGGTPLPNRLKIRCVTVGGLIQLAYGYFANGISYTPKILQVSGGPSWLNSDRYDIEATADGNPSQALMRGPMIQALLEERFKLKFHRDLKEGAVYVLTVAKNGLKMPSLAEGNCTNVDLKNPPPAPQSGMPPAILCGTEMRKKNGPILSVKVHGITMGHLADGLLVELSGRTVIDKTGLGGLFDLNLEFAPDQTQPTSLSDHPSMDGGTGPSIFTALREQLGLKLDSAKGPVNVFVVDHVERPSEN